MSVAEFARAAPADCVDTERHRERHRETERGRERQRETERGRERHKDIRSSTHPHNKSSLIERTARRSTKRY
eukprot:COSAG03_NODE_3500_length_1979_cov_33.601064_2_plen_72_part_00